jgi:hypothetical protein
MPDPNPTSFKPTRFKTKNKVKITVHGANFAQLPGVHVSLEEAVQPITWDDNPPVESSTPNSLTFHATPEGDAIDRGTGTLTVTVTNDDRSSGKVTCDVEYYN